MRHLRRVLAPAAAIWLFCQAATVMLAPVALWVAADVHAAECTCGHGADALCPMHRHKPADDPNNHCSMQAANQTGAAVLTTIIGAVGLLPDSTVSLAAPAPSTVVGPTDAGVRGERPVPPDPPPPRA